MFSGHNKKFAKSKKFFNIIIFLIYTGPTTVTSAVAENFVVVMTGATFLSNEILRASLEIVTG